MDSGQPWIRQDYDRKIRYLDYMENGARSHGVGFVKLEQRNGQCSIRLQISGLYRRDHFSRPLLLLSGGEERELCRLQLAEGGVKIDFERLDSRNLDGHGLCYEQVTGLRVPISEGKEIRCLWGAEQAPEKENGEAAAESTPAAEKVAGTVAGAEQAPGDVAETAAESTPAAEKVAETPAESAPADDASEWAAPPAVHDDKWTQLWAIYPHIAPFHDGREYMSMGPGDFVIFPAPYYKLVNNSFLLHGYYNYHHLVLAREEKRGSVKYYIGVPGNYYEREKKIAVMFGFENFECSAEPAEEGDFGYYMIPVEL